MGASADRATGTSAGLNIRFIRPVWARATTPAQIGGSGGRGTPPLHPPARRSHPRAALRRPRRHRAAAALLRLPRVRDVRHMSVEFTLEDFAYHRLADIAPCLYQFHHNGNLRYVGHTKRSLIRRIFQHILDPYSKVGEEIRQSIGLQKHAGWFGTEYWGVEHSDKLTDGGITIIPVVIECVNEAEQAMIKRLQPPLNVQYR